jgi:hypothetical protein
MRTQQKTLYLENKRMATETQAPAVIEAQATAPAVDQTETPKRRMRLNTVGTVIDPTDISTFEQFLSDFRAHSEANAPKKGYDCHFNKDGFVHFSQTKRISNAGAAHIVICALHKLAMAEAEGDAEAGAIYNALIEFAGVHRQNIQTAAEEAALAKAAEIQAKRAAADQHA